ncbi:MAG: hypothetical protein JO362_22220 [Streptomycetaceae bacterium]|nr:hypothetical protein [Streptomycetaceae bacterium]
MNVRIDWQPSGPQPRRSSSASAGPGGKRKGKGKDAKVFGALGVGALVTIVAAVTIGGGHKDTGGSHKGGTPAASAPASAGSDTGGLPFGTALASGADGTSRIGGLPRGFPRTTDGAVEAATTAMSAAYAMERLTPADRDAWVKDVWGKVAPDTEDKAKLYQAQNNLNSSGQLLDPATGQPVNDRRFTSLCHPELGAYKVVDSSTDAVTVDVWQVCISGVIGPGSQSDLTTNWMLGQFAMKWAAGDWRISSTDAGGLTTPPAPANSGQAVTTYAERAKILAAYGSGWELYRDASESNPAEVGDSQ